MWDFRKYNDRIALIDDTGHKLSYAELDIETECLAEAIGRRCLVFCLCENSIGSVIGYTALLNHKMVPVLLSNQLDQELLQNLINQYQPAFIWLPERKTAEFSGFEQVFRTYGYVLIRKKRDNYTGYPIYDELALLLTTSGSTGSPKFVRQSYNNIRSNTESIVEYLVLDSSERPITTLPMNYTYGLSIINTHLWVGATILLTEKGLMQKEFWTLFKEQKATSFGGVPYTYEMLSKLRIFRMDLPSLHIMTQAGGKITPELHEKFAEYAAETGRQFIVMYGQCEATARMGYLPPHKAVEKKGSMGIAIPGGKFRLIDTEGNDIKEPNATGELVYEGANVTLGYAECGEDLAKGDERNGVLVTGDMAMFDEDGYYYIVGRKKRFLKIYGNRVNLDEMDRLIKGKYDIEVTCAGIDDKMHIFITDKNCAEAVRSFVAEKTGLNASAFHMVVLDELPKNDSGKIKYKELEKYYEI